MVDFSVIILVHNERQTIAQIIERLICYSSHFSLEILILDSESTDNTPHIIKQLQKKHRLIKYLRIKRRDFHYADTRNKAVLLAKGKYVLLSRAMQSQCLKTYFTSSSRILIGVMRQWLCLVNIFQIV